MVRAFIASALVLGLALFASGPAAAVGKPKKDAFTLTSSDVKDNGILKTAMANTGAATSGGQCGGENISPALAWKNTPANTKSIAFLMFDPDGGGGMGVSHMVLYDIPASVHSLPRGGLSKQGQFVGGKNSRGISIYMGPCPPMGDAWHHYILQIYALDIPPGQLGPDLTRDDFLAKVKGKVLGEASLVMRYTR